MLRHKGYQKPQKVASSSYLDLKHLAFSSSQTAHHSTALNKDKMTQRHCEKLRRLCGAKHTAVTALPDVMSMLCLSSSSLLIFSSSSLCTVSNSSSFSLCSHTHTIHNKSYELKQSSAVQENLSG